MPDERRQREEICEIGRRLYARGFAAGNDGNLSVRLDAERVLCTPTLICKGFMRPDDLCVVDLEGRLLAGGDARAPLSDEGNADARPAMRKPTSEILLHLEAYRGDPKIGAVVHCHPPHATAFAVAREEVPSGVLAEVEVFLGVVPLAAYETPGGAAFAQTIRPYIGRANTVLLANHGTVSWGPTVERAYWLTEILDSYCRILMLARGLGNVERLPAAKVAELLALRPAWGMPPDERLESGELFVNEAFGRPERK